MGRLFLNVHRLLIPYLFVSIYVALSSFVVLIGNNLFGSNVPSYHLPNPLPCPSPVQWVWLIVIPATLFMICYIWLIFTRVPILHFLPAILLVGTILFCNKFLMKGTWEHAILWGIIFSLLTALMVFAFSFPSIFVQVKNRINLVKAIWAVALGVVSGAGTFHTLVLSQGTRKVDNY